MALAGPPQLVAGGVEGTAAGDPRGRRKPPTAAWRQAANNSV